MENIKKRKREVEEDLVNKKIYLDHKQILIDQQARKESEASLRMMYRAAKLKMKSKEFPEALSLLLRCSEEGNLNEAQHKIALCYRRGVGVDVVCFHLYIPNLRPFFCLNRLQN